MTVIRHDFRQANTHPLLSRAITRHARIDTVRSQMMDCEEALAMNAISFQPEDVDCLLRLLFLPVSAKPQTEAARTIEDNLKRSVNFLFNLSLRDTDLFATRVVDTILDQMCNDRVSSLYVVFHLSNTLSALSQFQPSIFDASHVAPMMQLRMIQPQLQNSLANIVNGIENREEPTYQAWHP